MAEDHDDAATAAARKKLGEIEQQLGALTEGLGALVRKWKRMKGAGDIAASGPDKPLERLDETVERLISNMEDNLHKWMTTRDGKNDLTQEIQEEEACIQEIDKHIARLQEMKRERLAALDTKKSKLCELEEKAWSPRSPQITEGPLRPRVPTAPTNRQRNPTITLSSERLSLSAPGIDGQQPQLHKESQSPRPLSGAG